MAWWPLSSWFGGQGASTDTVVKPVELPEETEVKTELDDAFFESRGPEPPNSRRPLPQQSSEKLPSLSRSSSLTLVPPAPPSPEVPITLPTPYRSGRSHVFNDPQVFVKQRFKQASSDLHDSSKWKYVLGLVVLCSATLNGAGFFSSAMKWLNALAVLKQESLQYGWHGTCHLATDACSLGIVQADTSSSIQHLDRLRWSYSLALFGFVIFVLANVFYLVGPRHVSQKLYQIEEQYFKTLNSNGVDAGSSARNTKRLRFARDVRRFYLFGRRYAKSGMLLGIIIKGLGTVLCFNVMYINNAHSTANTLFAAVVIFAWLFDLLIYLGVNYQIPYAHTYTIFVLEDDPKVLGLKIPRERHPPYNMYASGNMKRYARGCKQCSPMYPFYEPFHWYNGDIIDERPLQDFTKNWVLEDHRTCCKHWRGWDCSWDCMKSRERRGEKSMV